MTIEEDVDSDTPCPTQREGNLSNELRRMILSQQQSHPQVVVPPPMFNHAAKTSSNENVDPKTGHHRPAPAAPLFSFSTASQLTQGRTKTQNASQFMTSQDFVTPADQFDAEYDVMNCSQRAAGTLVRQRSPAAMSPMRMKRVNRMASPGRSVLGMGAAGTMAAAGTTGPAGGLGGGAVKGRVAPCYRSAFSDRVEEEHGLAGWAEPGKEGAIERPVVPSGSRYRDDFKETGMLGQVRCNVIACCRRCRRHALSRLGLLQTPHRETNCVSICRGHFVRCTALGISWTVKCMRSSERFAV